MRVMGVRAATQHMRYAVLELDVNGNIVWVNQGDEHKWNVPKAATTKQKMLHEGHKEFKRLLDKYKPEKVVLKIAENFPATAKASPERSGLEAVMALAAEEHHLPVTEKRYQHLKATPKDQMNSNLVEAFVLSHVTKPIVGWDKELADALAVGLRELGK